MKKLIVTLEDGSRWEAQDLDEQLMSPFAKFHAEALGYGPPLNLPTYPHLDARTYELIGPKINGNPEKVDRHTLRSHDYAASVHAPFPVGDVEGAYEALREILTSDVYDGVEGIVWHHPDGRMAKAQGARLPARGDEVGASDPRERNGGWDG